MLAIRLQRIGRSGLPMYRLAVQEAQRHPSSGRVIAYVGSYNPHTKEAVIKTEDAQKYLDNGAQPTPRVVKLLEEAGVKLPDWVSRPAAQQKSVKSPEKLRKNQPKQEAPVEEVAEAPVEAAEAPTEAE
jgi:small subunit ribosomal protein S16